ncbi:MAG: alpha/beta fold hydrolase [Micromonosporaceae bacterium]
MSTSDGVELYAEVTGAADAPVAVVYVHGWCLSSEIFRYQRQALADLGVNARVISYDVRGHARSGRCPTGSTTIVKLADDLRTVLDELCADVPAILVGHSLGGITIMELAERHPDLFGDATGRDGAGRDGAGTAGAGRVAGVVLVNTSAGELDTVTLGFPAAVAGRVKNHLLRELTRRHTWHLRRGDGRVRRRFTDAAIARYILFGRGAARPDVRLGRRLIATTHPGVVEGFFTELMAHDRYAALVGLAAVPVRILAGGRDRLTPPVHSRRLADALPHARLAVFPGVGHMIPLERSDELATEVALLARQASKVPAS